LHYREEAICEAIKMDRVKAKEQKKKYKAISKQLQILNEAATDFLDGEYSVEKYGEFFRNNLEEIGKLMGVKASESR
jgi:hypothetical protein